MTSTPRAPLRNRTGSFRLSVVVPCFNEQEVIAATHARLAAAVRAIPGATAELVFVDDGSRDRTLELLRGIAEHDATVRVVALSRNFGHQKAITAGVESASGDAVVLIDADLQDPPEVIAEFVSRWRSGADVAYGLRRARGGETLFKRASAHLFYRLMGRVADHAIPFDAGDFRLLDRAVVEALRAMPERDRFMRGMVAWLGFRQEAVEYDRHPRLAGETKYPLRRMIRFAMDGMFSFSTTPLRLATWLGLLSSAFAVVGVVYALYLRLIAQVAIPGWATLWISVLFLGGVQLVSLGVIGEYIGRIYGEVKQRPLYLVRERIGFEREEDTRHAR